MHCWRITKYDPAYRDYEGNFKKEEWTSFSDIGRVFGGKQFTITEYLSIESKYISAVTILMDYMNVSSLEISNLEKFEDSIVQNQYVTRNMVEMFTTIKDGDKFNVTNIPDLCKLILREHSWGKLSTSSMFVHFGYDFYMYIGLQKECRLGLNEIRESGLFIEAFTSPYLI
ncbi:MAG: hypothetical protein E7L01_27250 [Paenibacillus macerans]|uniref:Uncharacterized protein n=2 Tax=Paenibacillus macerans TaxID=44252 RepID=A0A090Y573_PAEMA|nr:hypothetical protein [Paenibacillus macerans]KFM92987.1 hypothetical protein DJ90_3035 [Paenibacillus macerans]MCY7562799.1 hypothetical protein [Paenibacillus macerans]MDU7477009.1 hypothetical protein [Paenibacillus macerans]MEC0141505.1 hypothetical protein [Paenibacillus macerans]MEC0155213.1 hypothetical protein [Paenibacillus macerans]